MKKKGREIAEKQVQKNTDRFFNEFMARLKAPLSNFYQEELKSLAAKSYKSVFLRLAELDYSKFVSVFIMGLSFCVFHLGIGYYLYLNLPTWLRIFLPGLRESTREVISFYVTCLIIPVFVIVHLKLVYIRKSERFGKRKKSFALMNKIPFVFLCSVAFFFLTSYFKLIQSIYALVAALWVGAIVYLLSDYLFDKFSPDLLDIKKKADAEKVK